MFRIKICGVTNVPDAVHAVDAGADAIGLNFYEKSSRFVDIGAAERVSAMLREGGVVQVGVFVNHTAKQVLDVLDQVSLLAVQIHGDETPSQFAHLQQALLIRQLELMSRQLERGSQTPQLDQPRIQAIRVKRVAGRNMRAIESDHKECLAESARPSAYLIDALSQESYGGSGAKIEWEALALHKSWLGDTPLILAGGLTPDNVADAIRIVRPHGVDVASGVESAPGKKDPHKVRDFIAAAQAAFAAFPK